MKKIINTIKQFFCKKKQEPIIEKPIPIKKQHTLYDPFKK